MAGRDHPADEICVRPAVLADVPGIQRIHALCDDPWGDLAKCAICVNHRLLQGLPLDVACAGDEVIGHAEWIVSDEPAPVGRHLYLAMIQVRSDWQGRGVGRAMIEAGIRRARILRCPFVRTVPDEDAAEFYRKCGFVPERRIVCLRVNAQPRPLPPGWKPGRTVPQGVPRRLPMRMGLVQGSAAHMWQLCNRPALYADEEIRHPCARRVDGLAYVQLRYVGSWSASNVLAIAWADADATWTQLLSAAMACAADLPVETLTVAVDAADGPSVQGSCNAQETGRHEVWSIAIE